MTGATAALAGFIVLLGLIALRMPVGLAMLVVGGLGYVHLASFGAFVAFMKTTPYHQLANYTLSVIPLFVLMGAIAERSGLSTALFRAAAGFVGHVRGGLAMAVIWAAAGFGAICGSSVATTATFARAVLPDLRRYGYADALATGTVAVGGTLGILIPPSIILVIYAIATEQNIAKLFMAALVPGVLAAVLYSVTISIMARIRPADAPAAVPVPAVERAARLVGIWPVGLVALVVVGGIYGGVFTPTEGAAVGAISMLAITVASRSLGWRGLGESLAQTAETSAMIFIILLGAEVYNAFLALTRLPTVTADFVAGLDLPPLAVIGVLLGIYIILGAVMDELAMLLLTLPVFFPVVQALDLGMFPDEAAIWFGVLVLIVVGMGLTAPPLGLNVFVVHAVARDVPITRTYAGVLPFLLADLIRLMLVMAFPGLALWLVRYLA